MTWDLDPRAAATVFVGGPPDLVGQTGIACERVVIDGMEVDMPRVRSGVPEYIAVTRAEARAEELRSQLLVDLDRRGAVPWQPNLALVFDMHAAAGTVVTGAMAGLEAYANHHLGNACPIGQSVQVAGHPHTLESLRRMAIDERYSRAMPQLLGRPRPTSEPWWTTFRRVQKLGAYSRHAITTPERVPGSSHVAPLSERFYNGEYCGAASMMLSAFEYFSAGWIPPGFGSPPVT